MFGAPSGAEGRQGQWVVGRARWEIGFHQRTPTQAFELLSFFLCRAGRQRIWRFKDWSDFQATLEDTAAIDGSHFQLQKAYSSGGITYTRTISKPVASTVLVFTDAGAPVVSGWWVDITTGIVTFGVAPGYVPKATFEFDVPARFDADELRLVQDDSGVRSTESIGVVEVLV